MSKISVQPPSGFRDYSPREAAVRAELSETIAREYRAFGFQQIFTSAAENLETLQGKGGGSDNEKLIFKLIHRGDKLKDAIKAAILEQEPLDFQKPDTLPKIANVLCDMGLRFDLTLPLARYVSHLRNELTFPLKVFHIGPVWRADRPQKGRFREFIQCDVDVIGTSGLGAEIECMGAIHSVFRAAGMSGVEFHLNDRRLLLAIGARAGFTHDQWTSALVTLDKLDKIGVDGVSAELEEKFGARRELTEILGMLTQSPAKLASFASQHEEATASLREIGDGLTALGAKVVFNPSLVRGQDYYTGTIFEARHPDLAGSLAGGGRYDKLLEVFGGPLTPAFGGSIGFERLMLLLLEKNAASAHAEMTRPQVFFPLMDGKLRPEILKRAGECRARGLRVDVYPDAAKLKNQFKYADQRGIPFTVLIGENEITAGQAVLKNMATQEQREVALPALADELERLCRK